MKVAKVICCYFGVRRNTHNTPKNVLDFVLKNIENEISIENGVDTDVFLVINKSKSEQDGILEKYNNVLTKNGKIIVTYRDNRGGSFGAYFETFLNYHENYDYWFFNEDDVLIYEPYYMKNFVDFFNSNEKIGFISLAPICRTPVHSGGGCGLTSTEKFLNVYTLENIRTRLSTYPKVFNYTFLEMCEVQFTNSFFQTGFEVINHPEYSPLCSNYEKHFGQKKYFNEEEINQKQIYQVGE